MPRLPLVPAAMDLSCPVPYPVARDLGVGALPAPDIAAAAFAGLCHRASRQAVAGKLQLGPEDLSRRMVRPARAVLGAARLPQLAVDARCVDCQQLGRHGLCRIPGVGVPTLNAAADEWLEGARTATPCDVGNRLMPEQQTLVVEWEKFSLEIYGKLRRGPVLDAHRGFYRGALAALLCLKRGTKFEDLVDEVEAVFDVPRGTLL
jgi:hypothetical protein